MKLGMTELAKKEEAMGRSRQGGARLVLLLAALTLVAAACGTSEDTTTTTAATTTTAGQTTTTAATTTSEAAMEMVDVKLQMQWFTQSQFAGYYAAVDQGFYQELGLNVEILEGTSKFISHFPSPS